jgi:SAM-dependent methyltransferase
VTADPVKETCLLCGTQPAKVLFTSGDRLFGVAPGTYSLVECSQCGLVRLSPRPTPEQVDGFYAKNYWFAGGWMQETYRRLVLRDHVQFAVASADETKDTILDVGCGGGLFLRMMKERGYNVLGFDFSDEAARVAREQNGIPVLVGDLRSIPIEPGSCALITMYHVVEHLLDPVGYLEAARRLLRFDGRLIVQVPDRDCWEAAMLGERWTGLDVPRHLHVFRTSDLRRLLEACGFEVMREKHFSLRDHPAGLATGLAPQLDPVARAIRRSDRSETQRVGKDLLYLALTAAALPFTVIEALFGKGSSVMLEAKVRRGQ